MPQEIDLPCVTAKELLHFPFNFKNNTLPENNVIIEMLNKLNLSESILDKEVSDISGGEKQRILLSSVILLNKPYLFLDEPTSALDDKNAIKLFDHLLELKNTTVIIASHHPYWKENADITVNIG